MTRWNRQSSQSSSYGRPISRHNRRRPGQRARREGILPVAGKILSAPFRGLWALYLKVSEPPVPPEPPETAAPGGFGAFGVCGGPAFSPDLAASPHPGRRSGSFAGDEVGAPPDGIGIGETEDGFADVFGRDEDGVEAVLPLRPGAAARARREGRARRIRLLAAAGALAAAGTAAALLLPGLMDRGSPPGAAGASAADGGVALSAPA
ncbi:MAG: hypothetical protein LBQ79_07835, partial [Deltaproteobacteria bacterium]|nr:hypothetical protein [Deltaproteobacteria bacterium]